MVKYLENFKNGPEGVNKLPVLLILDSKVSKGNSAFPTKFQLCKIIRIGNFRSSGYGRSLAFKRGHGFKPQHWIMEGQFFT